MKSPDEPWWKKHQGERGYRVEKRLIFDEPASFIHIGFEDDQRFHEGIAAFHDWAVEYVGPPGEEWVSSSNKALHQYPRFVLSVAFRDPKKRLLALFVWGNVDVQLTPYPPR